MQECLIYRLNRDITNIIELMCFLYRLKQLNKEYHRVFKFFDGAYYEGCPNYVGRCVVKYNNVTLHWFNGQFHRNPKNGPAKIWINGAKSWWFKGKRHREDGPAIIYPHGYKEYWVNGVRIVFD